MAHAIQVIIVPQNAMSRQTIRDRVTQTLKKLGLSEGESYHLAVCNDKTLAETLHNTEAAGDAALLIAELPTARRGNDIIPSIKDYLKRRPERADGVILVTQGGYFLDAYTIRQLSIPRKQVIRRLDDEGIHQLDGLVRNFVKVDLERGLTDYDHYATQLQKYRHTWRTPLAQSSVTGHKAHPTAHHTRRPDSPARDDAESVNANISDEQRNARPDDVQQKWSALAEDIKARASALFDAVKGEPLTADSPQLAAIHALLHLWVEAQLYALRAYSNYLVYHEANTTLRNRPHMAQETLRRIPPGFGINQNRFSVFKDVDEIVKKYELTLAKFDAALGKPAAKRKLFAARHRPFRNRMGDAEQFRTWSNQFGPDDVSPDIEPGWDVQAASAQRELDYHYRDALRREYRLLGYTAAATIMQVFRFIAGYGLRPQRTVYITFGVILGFMAAHWGDDAIARCPIPADASLSIPFLSGLQYYFSVSISSLTSLGSVATPCGPFHGLLLALETLFGYFLLAVLTTLFVQALSNR